MASARKSKAAVEAADEESTQVAPVKTKKRKAETPASPPGPAAAAGKRKKAAPADPETVHDEPVVKKRKIESVVPEAKASKAPKAAPADNGHAVTRTRTNGVAKAKKDRAEPKSDAPAAKSGKDKAKPAAGKAKANAAESEAMDEKDDAGAAAAGALDSNGNAPITNFRVSKSTVDALKEKNITHLFPIQAKTFDIIYEGKDVLGRAKTGTGKTLAFSLPVVERMLKADLKTKSEGGATLARGRQPRVVVLAPTRELALQDCKTFEMLGKQLQCVCVYGGAAYQPMEAAIRKGVDVIVGTCGRVKDLLNKGTLKFDKIEYVILDEADEMLNMGFAEDVEEILANVPKDGAKKPQTLLFSATVPAWVAEVAKKYLSADKVTVDLVGEHEKGGSKVVTTLVQHIAIPCHWSERNSVLGEIITVYAGMKGRTIIFTETKKEANELAMTDMKVDAQALHGDISQSQRETTLAAFRAGKFNCLVATDVAARGLDIPGVELVIQVEPPSDLETYVHRAGRTGRANKKGTCITFYTPKQLYYLQDIERRAGITFKRMGVPQQGDVIMASVKHAADSLDEVHPDVISLFSKAAEDLIESKGAVPALAAALAQISGHTQPPKRRSLLMSAQDYVTVHLKCNTEIRSLSFVWSMIRANLWAEPDEKVKGMRLTADKMGAVFDVPCELEQDVKNMKPNTRFKASIPTELPVLTVVQAERPPPKKFWGKNPRGGFGGGAGGDRRASFGGRGGGGTRGGGRGAFRGRGGSR